MTLSAIICVFQPHCLADMLTRLLKGSLRNFGSSSCYHRFWLCWGPESPTLVREDFRHSLAAGVAVIFFDFDGTLTATPGDRAARRTKQLELCERAAMLAPRLKSLCADGASLGIISKSTETCRDCEVLWSLCSFLRCISPQIQENFDSFSKRHRMNLW